MALLKATRTAQWPLVSTYTVNIGADSVVDINGATVNYKATSVVADVINLPSNAIVIGGSVAVIAVSDETGTATVNVGDAADDNRYTASPVNLKALGSTALTLTGFTNTVNNLRITLANQNGNATAGQFRVTVEYILDGRANEAVTH